MGGMLEGFSQSPVKETRMATQSFQVTGMTCGHCAGHVTAELKSVAGVSDVTVDLVAGGTSTVHVDADHELTDAEVTAALDEAGNYALAGR
jgi:copper chaperone